MQKEVVLTDERVSFSPPPEHYQPLPERGISKDSCEKFRVWKDNKGYYYFPSFLEGRQVGLKMRSPDKDFKWKGKQKDLFGQHLFPAGSAKFITVVEGEFDALSAYELLGSRYPVVSVLNGTGTAEQDVKRNWEYLNSFDNIVFAFDNDEAGIEAAKKCGALFEDGKVKILKLKKHKDANDYLKQNDANSYTKEWWNAPTLVKEGLKIGNEMWEEIVNRPSHFSTAYPFAGLQNFTYGIRLSEFVTVTADTGVGKTSLLKHIEHKLLTDPELIEKKYGVGFMHLEEPNYDTALGLMSIHNNKPYHLPDVPRTQEELKKAYDEVINNDRVVVWDHFGSNRIESVLAKVRHMAALGCKYIVIDHLSIIVSDQSGDERKQLDEISTKLKTLCMELNIALICVIHQNRQGQIRGTAGVEQISNIVMKAYRDNTNPDEWRRNVTKIVIEKNRFSGKCGPACWLFYNEMTSRLTELTEDEVKKYEEGGTIRDDEMPF
jgi:twinkle protein